MWEASYQPLPLTNNDPLHKLGEAAGHVVGTAPTHTHTYSIAVDHGIESVGFPNDPVTL